MRAPHVTVLTAVRNGAAYLLETIECIRAQTFADWEYLIVDDNSDDATCELVEGARRSDPRIRLIVSDAGDDWIQSCRRTAALA